MLNKLRPALARVLEPAGQALARTPLTPNAITIIGTVGVSASALAPVSRPATCSPAPWCARSSCWPTCWTARWPG